MANPLARLFSTAYVEHNQLEKHVRYLKWTEATAAFWTSLLVSNYLNSPKLDPKLERELRSMAMPALVTSREKYSEGCVTLDLLELTETEAIEVFSIECRGLGIDPTNVLKSSKDRATILHATGGVPLALKHVAILLDRGKSLKDALQGLDPNKGPIAEFCFRTTFNILEKKEKNIWVAMGIFQTPVTVAELAQVTEYSQLDISNALQTLIRYSIVNREVHSEGYDFFWCLPLTLEFAKRLAETWPEAGEMSHRLRQFRAVLVKAGVETEKTETSRVLKDISVIHPKLIARELSRKAMSKYRQGNVDEAYELIESAEKMDASEPGVWEARIEIELGEYQYDAALDACQKLLALTPNNLAALRQATNVAKRLEEWALAIQYCRRVTQLPGSMKRDWHILGHMYYRKAQKHHTLGERAKEEEADLQALDCFTQALIPNPYTASDKRHNATVYDTRARTLNYLGRTEEAREAVIQGLLQDPYNSKLLELQISLSSRVVDWTRDR